MTGTSHREYGEARKTEREAYIGRNREELGISCSFWFPMAGETFS